MKLTFRQGIYIRGSFTGVNEFKKCYQPRTNLVKD